MAGIYGPKFTAGVARLMSAGGIRVERGRRTCTDVYAFGLPSATRPSVSSVSGLPAYGDPLSQGSDLAVKSIEFSRPDPTSNTGTATVVYESGVTSVSEQGGGRSLIYGRSWDTRTVAADLCIDAVGSQPVLNSAGDPFDAVPQREMVLPSVSWQMLTNTAPSSFWALNGTVNASAVTVLGIQFVKHAGRLMITARESGDAAMKYEYSIRVDGCSNLYAENGTASPADIGWDIGVLDCGYNELPEGAAAPVPIYIPDSSGKLVRPQSPQPLNNGAWQPGGPGYYLKFSPYPESAWSGLHIPPA